MDTILIDFNNLSSELTKEYNIIAKTNRRTYTEFVDALSRKYGDEEFWWDLPFASRNIYIDDGFDFVCKLLLIKNKANIGRVEVLNSPKSVCQAAADNGLCVSFGVSECGNLFPSIKSFFVSRINLEKSYLNECRRVRRYFPKPKSDQINRKDAFIISSYREIDEFKTGVFKDRYFEGIQIDGRNIIYFCHPYFDNLVQLTELSEGMKSIKQCFAYQSFIRDDDFLVIKKFRKWIDSFAIERCEFLGLDISAIVSGQVHSKKCILNSYSGIMKGIALNRFIQMYGIDCRGIIDWYEGQSSSIGMLKRLRKVHPEIKTVGYCLSPCPENNIGLFPSLEQNKNLVSPEAIAIQGRAWESSAIQFDDSQKLMTAPSFRYSNVFSSDSAGENRDGLIVALPYLIKSSRNMLKCVLSTLAKIKYKKRILIKNHPNNINWTLELYGIEYETVKDLQISFTDKPLNILASECEIAVISESSSTLEMLLKGAKTITYIQPGKFDFACVPPSYESLVNVCYMESDLMNCINDVCLCCTGDKLKDIREECFTEVTKDTVHAFFDKIIAI